MLQKMQALEVNLMVDGEMGMAAEQLEAALERTDIEQQLLQAGRRIVFGLRRQTERGSAFPRTDAKGEGNMVAHDDLHVVVGQSQVLVKPAQLRRRQFTGTIISGTAGEMDVVEADVMHVAPVEAVVGGAEILLPLPFIQRFVVLVVVADDGEHRGARRPQRLPNLSFELCIIATVVLHVVTHRQGIDRRTGRPCGDG